MGTTMTFIDAINSTSVLTQTENGCVAYESTLDPIVDLFFKAGAMRGQDITASFVKAYVSDKKLALRLAFWLRDVRCGAGERELFRNILRHLEVNDTNTLVAILRHVPEYGRWDDLLIFQLPMVKAEAYSLISAALNNGNGLCSKWMPRKGPIANELRKFMKLTPKSYRKMLVSLTNVVEQKMCARAFDTIDFSHVPSLAAIRYRSAFYRNAQEQYRQYVSGLSKGETKVNAAAVYPYQVIAQVLQLIDEAPFYLHAPLSAEEKQNLIELTKAQWAALPNYMSGAKILPMVDVSGSMTSNVGGNSSTTCIDVAVSLGLYCADKNTGPFKDAILTFSCNPKLEVLRGDIVDKCQQLAKVEWGMNTNVEAAFKTILNVATANSVSADDMPEYLVIFSDMQFDRCGGNNFDKTAYQNVKGMFEAEGYTLPKLIFWNLNNHNNVPVTFKQEGTALLSGFSPSLMKSVLAGKEITPLSVMLETLNSERYSVI